MHGSDLVDRLQLYLHRIPHINFKFRRLSDDESFFDVSLRGDYAKVLNKLKFNPVYNMYYSIIRYFT